MMENNNDGYHANKLHAGPVHNIVPSQLSVFPKLADDAAGYLRFNGTRHADAESLADAIAATWPGGGRRFVVFTGGEPMLQLDAAMVALKTALGPAWSQTAVLVMTEFGRTVRANGTNGTDHGTAGVAFVLGFEDVGRLRFFVTTSSSESSGAMKSSRLPPVNWCP